MGNEDLIVSVTKPGRRTRARGRLRGVFERVPGSGVWWIRYVDAAGRFRREKAGSKSVAIDLYRKRKTEALQGKKLPEKLRSRVVRFSELCEDFRKYSEKNHWGFANDCHRISKLRDEFGELPAENIPIETIRNFFDRQKWAPESYNRVRTTLFSIFRLGIENGKVSANPAKPLKRKKVGAGRVRFLNQFKPLPTEIEYLRPLETEEARLRGIIEHDFPGTSTNL